MKNSCFENKSYIEFEKLKINRKIDKLNNLIGNYKILEDIFNKQNYEEFYRIKSQYIDEIKLINENKINTNLNDLKFPNLSINTDKIEEIMSYKLVNNFQEIEKKYYQDKDKQKIISSASKPTTAATSGSSSGTQLKNQAKVHSQRNCQVQSGINQGVNQNEEYINVKKPVSKDKEKKAINIFQDNLFNNKNTPNHFIKNNTNCILAKGSKPRIESCERSPTEPSKKH